MKEKKQNICCLLHFHPQPTQQDTESSDLTNRSNSSSATGRCYFYIRLCYVYIYIYVWNFRINEFENFQKQKLGFRWEKTKRHVFSRFSNSQVHMDFSRVYTHFRDQRIRLWIVGINATAFKGKIATPAARISLATFERIPQKVFEGCFWGEKVAETWWEVWLKI